MGSRESGNLELLTLTLSFPCNRKRYQRGTSVLPSRKRVKTVVLKTLLTETATQRPHKPGNINSGYTRIDISPGRNPTLETGFFSESTGPKASFRKKTRFLDAHA